MKIQVNLFLNSIIESKNSNENKNIERTNNFTYENIKGISLEEIDSIFESDKDKNMATNLRLATLFTNDDKYAFLYNDYNLQYQELEYKYNELKNYDRSFISQF